MNPHASCPRCDYDLSGETSRWEEQCPLRGRCPECGLDFEWTHVCHPERWILDGFVEHARGLPQTVRWAWRTWWWAVLPWRFWGRVQMHHKVSTRGIAAWFGIVVLGPHVVGGLVLVLLGKLSNSFFVPGGWAVLNEFVYPLCNLGGPWQSVPEVQWTFSSWPTMGVWITAGFFAIPVLLGVMPISLRRAQVRRAQVARAFGFSAAVPGSLLALTAAIRIVLEGVFLGSGSSYRVWDSLSQMSMHVYRAYYVFASLWLALWWLLVLTVGWRLRQGWAVWLCLMVMGALIATGVGGFEFVLFGRVYRF